MNIVFIVVVSFPYGSASSMRARNLYKLFELAGHKVHVISDFDGNGENNEGSEFSCESIYGKDIDLVKRNTASYKSLEKLKEYCKTNNVDCVVMNARNDRFNAVAKFCKKNKIKFIVENCEWYDKSSFKFGCLDIRYFKNEKMLKRDFKKADGFISISRLLDEHNKGFDVPSVRVPTILDVENTEYSLETSNEKITVVYTGNPGKSKEFLLPVIKALAENPELKEKVEFHIYGPSYNTVLRNIENNEEYIKKAGESVVIHGKIPQEKIQDVLQNADFSVFLRPDRKSSNAGFPTKLGECFAVATPVITNDTGDIGLYVKNGENGYIIDKCDSEEIKKVFEEIISKTKEEREKMRYSARKTAEDAFDYRRYKEKIEFLFGEEKCD